MDGCREYSVERFKMCTYFSHKVIDHTGETRVLEKYTDILLRGNFYLGKNWHKNILRPRVYTVSKSFGQSLFRFKGKTIYNKPLECKGNLMVVDLIDDDGKFSSWEKLSQKFNLSTVEFLEWDGRLHSIPRGWKNIVNENTFLPETLDKQVLFKFHHGVFKATCFYNIFEVKISHVYELFVQKKIKLSTAKATRLRNIYIAKNMHHDK